MQRIFKIGFTVFSPVLDPDSTKTVSQFQELLIFKVAFNSFIEGVGGSLKIEGEVIP